MYFPGGCTASFEKPSWVEIYPPVKAWGLSRDGGSIFNDRAPFIDREYEDVF
jgi:hypothetical protein